MSRKARILYWTPRFWPDIGGVEVFAMQMLPALQERNYGAALAKIITLSERPFIAFAFGPLYPSATRVAF